MPFINEAAYALQDGVAEAEAIDTIAKLGFAHPMGPLALADLIGLDTCVAIMEVLHEGLGDPKYAPCPLLRVRPRRAAGPEVRARLLRVREFRESEVCGLAATLAVGPPRRTGTCGVLLVDDDAGLRAFLGRPSTSSTSRSTRRRAPRPRAR